MLNKIDMPGFKDERDEADWWASDDGRSFVRQESASVEGRQQKLTGSRLVSGLSKTSIVQIALRLPESDLAETRRIAMRKGIGYQTLLKMLLHEGLEREAGRR